MLRREFWRQLDSGSRSFELGLLQRRTPEVILGREVRAVIGQGIAVGSAKSLREQLEKYRASAACPSCQSRLDPLGFSRENFDGVRHYRIEEGVITFMYSRDGGNRTYPQVSVPDAHHGLSHHMNDPAKIARL